MTIPRLSLLLLLPMFILKTGAAEPAKFEIRPVIEKKAPPEEAKDAIEAESQDGKEHFLLSKEVILTGADIKNSWAVVDTDGWRISVILTDKGKEKFAIATEKHLKERLAIVVNGKVSSAPVVYSKIPDGKLVISGNFTEEEAKKLAEEFTKGG